ncbi:NAD(P)H-binding protein [Amycolatopsis suaedae]|uniref:NAD-dependent epimerase/dehydratase family protein n=1 Tax=Amycolatopsis suaedae TaxID=2510978 RepID=A0A4Q7J2R8_9PSEU|nr:NAD(P)H-binding protein [Amycolatopsis suaedae]RZQ61217.1 NAD-dependent epimerase/dehydratase family protein [Amycolatopsis suaedae]
MTVLVTGATGTVGRQVVAQLAAAGHPVRALTRDPAKARLPEGVEVARGDLTEPDSVAPALDGVTGLHLITFGGDDGEPLATGPRLVELATRAGVRRVSVLSGFDRGGVEAALADSTLPWAHLQPVEFMANALEWAESARTEGVVRVFGDKPGSVVHEADIAAVAVAVLTTGGLATAGGSEYPITGPEPLSPRQRVAILAEAAGRPIRFEPLTEDQERARLAAMGWPPDYVEFGIQLALDPPAEGAAVTPTVREVTGRPPRTFAQWASEHAAEFRP